MENCGKALISAPPLLCSGPTAGYISQISVSADVFSQWDTPVGE